MVGDEALVLGVLPVRQEPGLVVEVGDDGEARIAVDDADVPRFWHELGLPGLVDVHVHFLPDRVQAKVWEYFGAARDNYGTATPPPPACGARRTPPVLANRSQAIDVAPFKSVKYFPINDAMQKALTRTRRRWT